MKLFRHKRKLYYLRNDKVIYIRGEGHKCRRNKMLADLQNKK